MNEFMRKVMEEAKATIESARMALEGRYIALASEFRELMNQLRENPSDELAKQCLACWNALYTEGGSWHNLVNSKKPYNEWTYLDYEDVDWYGRIFIAQKVKRRFGDRQHRSEQGRAEVINSYLTEFQLEARSITWLEAFSRLVEVNATEVAKKYNFEATRRKYDTTELQAEKKAAATVVSELNPACGSAPIAALIHAKQQQITELDGQIEKLEKECELEIARLREAMESEIARLKEQQMPLELAQQAIEIVSAIPSGLSPEQGTKLAELHGEHFATAQKVVALAEDELAKSGGRRKPTRREGPGASKGRRAKSIKAEATESVKETEPAAESAPAKPVKMKPPAATSANGNGHANGNGAKAPKSVAKTEEPTKPAVEPVSVLI